jgi:hypothetical protein
MSWIYQQFKAHVVASKAYHPSHRLENLKLPFRPNAVIVVSSQSWEYSFFGGARLRELPLLQ